MQDLTDDNFLMYAMKHYENPQCRSIEEFRTDLNHIKYLKRLFKRYLVSKDFESLRIRLVLNHLIVFYNVFNVEAGTKILFFKIDRDMWSILKTFLVFLGYMPESKILGVDGSDIVISDIPLDMGIVHELRKI